MSTHDDFILLQERLEDIGREFDLLKKQLKTEQDWPQKGDFYWTFNSGSEVFVTKHADGDVDTRRKENHMIFQTEKAATLARDQGLAYRKLWELADGGGYSISKHCNEYLCLNFSDNYGIPKFSSTKKGMEAVTEIGEELLDTIFDQGET